MNEEEPTNTTPPRGIYDQMDTLLLEPGYVRPGQGRKTPAIGPFGQVVSPETGKEANEEEEH